jgi:hypothetical protein
VDAPGKAGVPYEFVEFGEHHRLELRPIRRALFSFAPFAERRRWNPTGVFMEIFGRKRNLG